MKLKRARQHIQTIENEVRALVETYKNEMIGEFNFDTDEEVFQFIAWAVINNLPPPLLGTVIGDAIHNLRATLDYLMYEVACRIANSDPPPNERHVFFPILLNKKSRDSRAVRNLWNRLPSDIATLVEGIQPRNTGNANSALWILNELSNRDKHRRLSVTVTLIKGLLAVQWGDDPPILREFERLPMSGVGKAPVLILQTGKWVDKPMQVQVDPAFDIAFSKDTPRIPEYPVVQILRLLAEAVERVVDAFDPVFYGGQMAFPLIPEIRLATHSADPPAGVLPSKG